MKGQQQQSPPQKQEEEEEVEINKKTDDVHNWSEKVEDLIAEGDTDGAISLLETVVSNLQSQTPVTLTPSSQYQLASALTELACIYSSKGFSLKSDELLSLAKLRSLNITPPSPAASSSVPDDTTSSHDASCSAVGKGHTEVLPEPTGATAPGNERAADNDDDDDWEAVADRAPDELLTSQLPSLPSVPLEDTETDAPRRRGRGTFSYKRLELYSDQQSNDPFSEDVEDGDSCKSGKQDIEAQISKYGTSHVLVLADFPPSTRTTDLEELLQSVKDFVIRWVNDTVALVVFRTPSLALEAGNNIHFPFSARILKKDDILLELIPAKDLEPPRQRPATSARTAQRLIAQGMGLKLPSNFGSRELKIQEEARKTRINSRHKMRDDAWGGDDKK